MVAGGRPDVVLTRERGKNGRLMSELQQRGVTVLEMPLIESCDGPDR
jgi:uroporphyrinogen-III synthase